MSRVTMEMLRGLVQRSLVERMGWSANVEEARIVYECGCYEDGNAGNALVTCEHHSQLLADVWKAIEGDRRHRPLSVPALESLRQRVFGDIQVVTFDDVKALFTQLAAQECVMGDWMQERDPQGYEKGFEDGYRKALADREASGFVSRTEVVRDQAATRAQLEHMQWELEETRRRLEGMLEENQRRLREMAARQPIEIDGEEIDLTNYAEVLARGIQRWLLVDPQTVRESNVPKDGGVGS